MLAPLFSRLRSRSLSQLSRQITPPTKNGHAPPPTKSRKSSQSVNPYCVWTWWVSPCWVKLSRRLHSWWCPSVNSFKFQLCNNTTPGGILDVSRNSNNSCSTSHKTSVSSHRSQIKLRRYLIVFNRQALAQRLAGLFLAYACALGRLVTVYGFHPSRDDTYAPGRPCYPLLGRNQD